MKLRDRCVLVGFCSLVMAIAAQNSGITTSASQLPRLLKTSEATLSNFDAKLSPTSLNFGTVTIGTTSPAKDVTLTNEGTTTLNITKIAIGGTDVHDFAQTHSCESSLAAGASCIIRVRFKPTASGARMATVRVSDNGGASPQIVHLSGTGAAGSCTRQGMECAPQFPPCCPGLVCVPASTRAFCEPAGMSDIKTPQGLSEQ